MKLTDPIAIPDWLRRAVAPAASIFLLCCAVDFLNWQFIDPAIRKIMWDGGSQRCFENGGLLMPLASALRLSLCPQPNENDFLYPTGLHACLTWACLYGSIAAVWLAARALSGYWSAGIAAAIVATSPFLFAFDSQLSPASLGLLFVLLASWLAIEASKAQTLVSATAWRALWICFALLALGMCLASVWIVAAQIVLVAYPAVKADRHKFQLTVAAIVCLSIAVVIAFVPTSDPAAAVVRAEIRALPEYMLGLSYPDEWLDITHMSTYIGAALILAVAAGVFVGRSAGLATMVAGLSAQVTVASILALAAVVKLTNIAFLVPLIALAIGSGSAFLIKRKPHMLAFVLPALVVAAQYAAFARLPLEPYQAFDFDHEQHIPTPAFARGESARLYHDRGHAEFATLHHSVDGFAHDNDSFVEPATTAVIVSSFVPFDVTGSVDYTYAVSAKDGSWKGYAGDFELWIEPAPGRCLIQPYSALRLYDRPSIGYRQAGDSVLVPANTNIEVLDIDAAPYEPELHVRALGESDIEGWIYAQVLMFGNTAAANRSGGSPCPPI